MATCIEKLPCLDCNSIQSIQTYLNIDDALGIEWYTSFCHGACWENKGDPYSGSPPKVTVKTEADIKAEVEIVRSCRLFKTSKPYRGIPTELYQRWGVRLLLSEFDGKTPYSIGFPMEDYGELVGWKCRPLLKKDFYGVGRSANVDPYGLARALNISKEVIWVTEGEFDAIALEYAMMMAGKSKRYPVISLTHGGGSIDKNFKYIEDRLAHHKWIVLVLDDDIVGKKAEKTAISMWPDRVVVVSKPKGSKDANDAVKSGLATEMGKLALNFKSSI
jgi:hypothetical protein